MQIMGSFLKDWERIMSAFLDVKPAPWLEDAAGLGVRVERNKAILECHPLPGGIGDGPAMDVAEWDQTILAIPGPHRGDKRWWALTENFIWETRGESPGTTNMIGYLIWRALVRVHGEKGGEERWARVRGSVPHPHEPLGERRDDRLYWIFGSSLSRLDSVAFSYPFVSDIANGSGPHLKCPSPYKLLDRLAATNHPEAESFAAKTIETWGIILDEKMKERIAGKFLRGKLDRFAEAATRQ